MRACACSLGASVLGPQKFQVVSSGMGDKNRTIEQGVDAGDQLLEGRRFSHIRNANSMNGLMWPNLAIRRPDERQELVH